MKNKGKNTDVGFHLSPGKKLALTKQTRRELGGVHGRIYSGDEFLDFVSKRKGYLITVGDMVSLTAIKGGIRPNISVFDMKTERKKTDSSMIIAKYKNIKNVENKKGEITYALYNVLSQGMKKRYLAVKVHGEEDLAAPLCIAISKKGTLVAWGVPGKGINLTEVNEKTRQHALDILKAMRMK